MAGSTRSNPEPCKLDGSTTYILTGKKGVRYHTLRNKPNPQAMFLIPEEGFSKTMDRVWLTDRNGVLEVASS